MWHMMHDTGSQHRHNLALSIIHDTRKKQNISDTECMRADAGITPDR